MLSDIIIIIPTHKRQHYLNRVAWYYSHFDMQVYICDSTPGAAFEIDKYDNINYLWCPDKTFNTKILHVLNTTHADFYATSPDDDFLKEETLMGCYEAMKADRSYSMAVGRQAFFKEKFEDGIITSNNYANGLAGLKFGKNKTFNSFLFWSHYQNVLWTLFRKDIINKSFTELLEKKYDSQNFIEMTVGMNALAGGAIFVSDGIMNVREVITGEHWGSIEKIISVGNYFKYNSMRCDFNKVLSVDGDEKMIRKIGLLTYLMRYGKIAIMLYRVKNKLGRVIFGEKQETNCEDPKLEELIRKALQKV